jgi:hypothetical protein
MPVKKGSDRAKITAARHKLKKDKPILTGGFGRVTPSIMRRISDRWSKRKEYEVLSSEKMGKNIPATVIARRFSTRELMRPLRGMRLSPEALQTVERIIQNRRQTAPRSSVQVRQDTAILSMKLMNLLGQRKAAQVMNVVLERGKLITKNAKATNKKRGKQTDVFINIPQNLGSAIMEIQMELDSPREFADRVQNIINEKQKELAEVGKKANEKERRRLMNLLLAQVMEAGEELQKFKINFELYK